MEPSLGFSAAARNVVHSLGWRDTAERLLDVLPDRVQNLFRELRADAYVSTHDVASLQLLPVEPLKALQRSALRFLASRHGGNNVGDYLEFGVFAGSSMGCMAEVLKELRLDNVRSFGFDPFVGTHAIAGSEGEGTWQPGPLKFDLEITKALLRKRGADMSRITLTKGWFDRTLSTALRQQHALRKASVIMVDCDVYASTVEVLRFVEPLILDEVVIIFHDWSSSGLASRELGEKRAFEEFLEAHPGLTATPLPFDSYASHAHSFLVARVPTA